MPCARYWQGASSLMLWWVLVQPRAGTASVCSGRNRVALTWSERVHVSSCRALATADEFSLRVRLVTGHRRVSQTRVAGAVNRLPAVAASTAVNRVPVEIRSFAIGSSLPTWCCPTSLPRLSFACGRGLHSAWAVFSPSSCLQLRSPLPSWLRSLPASDSCTGLVLVANLWQRQPIRTSWRYTECNATSTQSRNACARHSAWRT